MRKGRQKNRKKLEETWKQKDVKKAERGRDGERRGGNMNMKVDEWCFMKGRERRQGLKWNAQDVKRREEKKNVGDK